MPTSHTGEPVFESWLSFGLQHPAKADPGKAAVVAQEIGLHLPIGHSGLKTRLQGTDNSNILREYSSNFHYNVFVCLYYFNLIVHNLVYLKANQWSERQMFCLALHSPEGRPG